jgi:hypothetical protein
MPTLSLPETALLIDAVAEFERVQRLDDVWTAEVQAPSAKLAELEEVALSLKESIERSGRLSSQVRRIALANPEESEGTITKLLNDPRITKVGREWWERVIENSGGIPALIDGALNEITLTVQDSIAQVDHELTQLRRGVGAEGDLPPRTKCGIMIGLAIAGGLAATVLTGGAAAFGLLTGVAFASAGGAYCGAEGIDLF